jgi:hypothetical protein
LPRYVAFRSLHAMQTVTPLASASSIATWKSHSYEMVDWSRPVAGSGSTSSSLRMKVYCFASALVMNNSIPFVISQIPFWIFASCPLTRKPCATQGLDVKVAVKSGCGYRAGQIRLFSVSRKLATCKLRQLLPRTCLLEPCHHLLSNRGHSSLW